MQYVENWSEENNTGCENMKNEKKKKFKLRIGLMSWENI